MILATALVCMSINLYHEARGEPFSGQHAVAQVTMNRANRDPKNVCKVVLEPKQFSWTNGKMVQRKRGKTYLTKLGEPKDKKAWNLSVQIAKVTLQGVVYDFTKGATHYHARRVDPVWNRKLRLVSVIGHHRFYRYTS